MKKCSTNFYLPYEEDIKEQVADNHLSLRLQPHLLSILDCLLWYPFNISVRTPMVDKAIGTFSGSKGLFAVSFLIPYSPSDLIFLQNSTSNHFSTSGCDNAWHTLRALEILVVQRESAPSLRLGELTIETFRYHIPRCPIYIGDCENEVQYNEPQAR